MPKIPIQATKEDMLRQIKHAYKSLALYMFAVEGVFEKHEQGKIEEALIGLRHAHDNWLLGEPRYWVESMLVDDEDETPASGA